jgi:hypothetical protein
MEGNIKWLFPVASLFESSDGGLSFHRAAGWTWRYSIARDRCNAPFGAPKDIALPVRQAHRTGALVIALTVDMDLGIRGRKAIVCGSSQGLGKGCALALAEAGVNLVINGRPQDILEETAEEIRRAAGVAVIPVAAGVSTREGQDFLLAACPEPDTLINNNGGPPFRDFRELDRAASSSRRSSGT